MRVKEGDPRGSKEEKSSRLPGRESGGCLSFFFLFYIGVLNLRSREKDEIMLSRFEAIFTAREKGKWREDVLSLLFQVALLLFL